MTNPERKSPGSAPSPPEGGLTSAQFHILVALSEAPCHGYGIMQEVERRTDGSVDLGPGTLYRSLRQLMDRGLIQEAPNGPEADSDGGKPRRSYAITSRGRQRAADEAERLRTLVRWADEAMGEELERGMP